MSWRRARFKGKDVWVEVDPLGAPVVEGGRSPIRYSNKRGARIYRGGAAGVELDLTAAVRNDGNFPQPYSVPITIAP